MWENLEANISSYESYILTWKHGRNRSIQYGSGKHFKMFVEADIFEKYSYSGYRKSTGKIDFTEYYI
jgi:hypothetical protein